MPITLVAKSDTTSTLIERTCSSSVEFNVPLSAAALVALIKDLLVDPDAREVTSGPVRIDRMRDGPRVHVGSANFAIRYLDVFPLILEA